MFQPVIPQSGLAGWRFLQRTYDTQFDNFSKNTSFQRDTDYFRANINKVSSAEQLVKDRKLLGVALGAFNLQDDIDNRFFIRKILEEGVKNDDSLANRFTDPRYRELSKAFGFGPGELRKNTLGTFADKMIDRHLTNSFEIAAGDQDSQMRVALYAKRELETLVGDERANDTKWFSVMGDPPMRKLFEAALNLPKSIGQIDIDQQLGVFKAAAQRAFGTDDLSVLAASETREDVITKFIVRSQIRDFSAGMSSNAVALTLLQA